MTDRTYSPVTNEILQELKAIVGERYVIAGDDDKLEPYSHDEVKGEQYAHMPECVVRPRKAEEIAEIMKLANREHVAVTPRGAGSGMSGGAVPIEGGIVLLMDRMNDIVELDKENMMITVEPGVVANDINEYLAEYDLFYAGYPMSLETCFIGGNVAENAGGGKAVKYGVTSRYVLGLEVVTPTGEIVELGGKLIKDVTGYNMIQLMVGSEGTLGVFTKIVLKLMPLPKSQVDLLCLFDSAEQAIECVPQIMTRSGIIPTAIEFMDRTAVRAACEYLNESIPYEQAGAMLLITVDGPSEEQVEHDYMQIGDQCMEAGASEVYVADNSTTSERVWKVRRNIGEAYNVISKRQCAEDIVVPPACIPAIVGKLGELSEKYDVMMPCFGHAGDGNLHARIVSPPEWSDEQWEPVAEKILNELYKFTAQCGGRISGEHGIGHKRKKYMSYFVSEGYLDMLRAVKRGMDPNNILNPGKIFDLQGKA
ncbi:putative FAD-linked oxidoreductase [Anaerohalosphaera lusitana]|uniref:Putative FAD-linked oxidoreductase n=1 Tax=Anaerohalosphaera lusitana TaxID=1936003 RepID=A0A1U9NN15_9BACT|nr:FAD-linked oxidase C-terminal domain-containing protein [Anaerohalosphaera lusitana]AQT69000.1 putative FAD-linked oxidoreductase [Anaerohalosphaera lusitana]